MRRKLLILLLGIFAFIILRQFSTSNFFNTFEVSAQTPVTRTQQTFLNLDGRTQYARICEFDQSTGFIKAETCSSWSNSTISQTINGRLETYIDYASFVFKQGAVFKIRQSYIALDGKTQRYRTCDFNNDTGEVVNCPSAFTEGDLSNIRGVGNETYDSHSFLLFKDGTKMRQSFISYNRDTQYERICDFDNATGFIKLNTCSTWNTIDLDTQSGVAGEKYSSYAGFVFRQGNSFKIRDSYITSDGNVQRYRTCDFNNETGFTINCPSTFTTLDLSSVRGEGSELYGSYQPLLFPVLEGLNIPLVVLTPTLDPNCPKKPLGDANCDQAIDLKDYEIWKCEFLGGGVCSTVSLLPSGTTSTSQWANFNFQKFDQAVNLVDFEIWRKNTSIYINVSPTAGNVTAAPAVTNTPTLTSIPIPTKTSTPTPTPSYQSRILFTSNRYGNSDIFVKELNGQENRLTTSDANDYEPKISKSGTSIVFTSYRDLNNEIYVMNANGTNQVNLTNNSNSDINPVMSPDGTKIAFSSNRNREGNYDLYLMDLQGTVTRLTNKPLDDTQPNFSPDGKKIVFTSYRDGQPEIYTLDLTKPNADPALNYDPQRWTNSPALDFQPAFDPTDNSKIVFTSSRPGYYRIYTMSLVKSVTKPFPDVIRLNSIAGNYNDIEPSYSWDGKRIVFISQRVKNLEIWAMNSDGTNQDRITDNLENESTPVFFP